MGPHPYIPVPLVYKVVVNQILGGEPTMNVLHVGVTDFINLSTLASVATAVQNWWIANIKPITSTTLSLVSVEVTSIAAFNGGRYILFAPAGTTGNINTPPLPNNVALVVSYTGLTRGRGSQGRTYHMGIVDAAAAANDVTAFYAGQVNAAYIQLRTDLAVLNADLTQRIVSYCLGGVWRSIGESTVITNSTVGTRLDTQRRRLPRRR
jgi:hypothetical protein